MIDIIDEVTPFVAPVFSATRQAVRRVVAYHLLPPVLFFLACAIALIATSVMLRRVADDATTGTGIGIATIDRQGGRKSAMESGVGLFAYPIPSLKVSQSDDLMTAVNVRMVAASTLSTDSTSVGPKSQDGTGMWDGGRALYDDVQKGIVNILVIGGSVWRATSNHADPGILVLTAIDPSTTSIPVTSDYRDWATSGTGWGSTGGGALVIAFKKH